MKALRALLGGLAGLSILTYVAVALLRMRYGFDLEWMEGAVADHVRRLIDHKPLYVPPSLDFTPFIYPPLYYYSAFLLAKVLSAVRPAHEVPLLLVLRAVSFASSVVCGALIYALARRLGGSRLSSFLSVGLFAALFAASGAWYDLARLDSLFLALVLAGVYVLSLADRVGAYAAAGLLFALAFLTKQSALAILVPMLAYGLFAGGVVPTLVLAGVFALVAGVATFILNVQSHGWYGYYIFTLPGQHLLYKAQIFKFWAVDILVPLSITCLLVLLWFGRGDAGHPMRRKGFYGAALTGMLVASYISRIAASYLNVLMPVYAALAIGCGIGLQSCLERLDVLEPRHRKAAEAFLYVACCFQLVALFYNPLKYVPKASDAVAGNQFVARIAQIPGDVYLPYHGNLPLKAGKMPHAHFLAIADVLRGKDGKVKTDLMRQIEADFERRRFSAVITDEATPEFFSGALNSSYTDSSVTYGQADRFWTVTGLILRPSRVYVPMPR